MTQYVLGFLAGGLSLLAPCVLPILPLVVASSLKTSRLGPYASALGLTLSFTLFGVLTSVFASVFDPDFIRDLGAIILIGVGLVFLVPSLKAMISTFFNKVSLLGSRLEQKVQKGSLLKEFLGGAVLGMVWSPCTGPTLAIAIGLASQSQNLLHSSFVFFFFGLGAGLGLVALGLLIQKFSFLRSSLLKTGSALNYFAGALSLLIGVLILTGLEAELEEFILQIMPDWLIQLSVVF